MSTSAAVPEGWAMLNTSDDASLPWTSASPSHAPASLEATAGSASGAGPALKSARDSTPGTAAAARAGAQPGEAEYGLGAEREEAASAAQGAVVGRCCEGVSGSEGAKLVTSYTASVGGGEGHGSAR